MIDHWREYINGKYEDKEKRDTIINLITNSYPSQEELPKKFKFEWTALEVSPPDNPEMKKQFSDKINSYLNEIVDGLRKRTVEVVSEVKSQIESGSPIGGGTLEKLRNYIRQFRKLNFMGDHEIEANLINLQSEMADWEAAAINKSHDSYSSVLGEVVEACKSIMEKGTKKVIENFGQTIRTIEI
jgi:hypothetical protein